MLMVYKALMQCAFDTAECNIVASIGKDVAQALYLASAVAEDVYLVAALGKVAQRLGYQLKILMVYTLWRAMQIQSGRSGLSTAFGVCSAGGVFRIGVGCGAQSHTAHSVITLGKSLSVYYIGAYIRDSHSVLV